MTPRTLTILAMRLRQLGLAPRWESLSPAMQALAMRDDGVRALRLRVARAGGVS